MPSGRRNSDPVPLPSASGNAPSKAAIVVIIAAVAAAIGSWRFGPGHILGSAVTELLGWASWAAITYWIGTRFFGGTATWGELARTLGFAKSPGVLLVLGIIPVLGGLVHLVVWIWMLVAGVIAIRQALDIDTGKAVLVALCGFAVQVVISLLLSGLR